MQLVLGILLLVLGVADTVFGITTMYAMYLLDKHDLRILGAAAVIILAYSSLLWGGRVIEEAYRGERIEG
jgi:hypothetical protein